MNLGRFLFVICGALKPFAIIRALGMEKQLPAGQLGKVVALLCNKQWAFVAYASLVMLFVTCSSSNEWVSGKRNPEKLKVAEWVFDNGLTSSWNDYGWAPRMTVGGGPAILDMSKKGSWSVGKPGLSGKYGGLIFRFRAPREYGDFLEVRVESTGSSVFPRIKLTPAHRLDLGDRWSEVYIPMSQLNPAGSNFDRIIIRAHRLVGKEGVAIDQIGLTERSDAGIATDSSTKKTKMVIDCAGKSHRVKPMIFGIASGSAKDTHQWQMGATARRWGGNPSSRYNWMTGNWNTGNDWFFRNIDAGATDNVKPHQQFLDENSMRQVKSALTVPILGWVAKDSRSYSFPVSGFGKQRANDPQIPDAGDGFTKDGKPISPGPPGRTSVMAPPVIMGRWVSTIKAKDKDRPSKSVAMYILDNEPFLWNSTHRDVHPEPTTYDELLERTIAFGTAVRKADPEAVIAGPALWGWPAYFYSAKDAAVGFELRPDRRAHNDMPFLPWFLQKLKEHQQKTGVRILDVLDVHFYPQGKGLKVGANGDIDPDTNARRIRATRGLWDPTYVDESWINDTIKLLPRLKGWIDEYSPGMGISIGEYNFGAENHMSGALALAEALGRFAQANIDSAFYWTYPEKDSLAFWAFRAWRNFDDKGGRFLDWMVPTDAPRDTSLFASRDDQTGRVVAIALNLDPQQAADASIDIASCGAVAKRDTYTLTSTSNKLTQEKSASDEGSFVRSVLPPYSITVFDIQLAKDQNPQSGSKPRAKPSEFE